MAGGFRRVFGPVLIIAIAGVIQLSLLDLDVGDYWPVLLILFGVALLFRGPRLRRRVSGSGDPNRVDAVAIMGGSEHRTASQDFVGGQALSVMGGIEIDLSEAAVIERPATLDVTGVMGGVQLTVPADWSVSVDALVLMGGSSDERKAGQQREPSIEEPHDLVVTGLVLLGGIEVKG